MNPFENPNIVQPTGVDPMTGQPVGMTGGVPGTMFDPSMGGIPGVGQVGYPQAGMGYPPAGYPQAGMGYPQAGVGYPQVGYGYPGAGFSGQPMGYGGYLEGRVDRMGYVHYTRAQMLEGLRNYVIMCTQGRTPISKEEKIEETPQYLRHACAECGVSYLEQCQFNIPEVGVSIPFYFCLSCGKLFYYKDFYQ